MSFDKSPPEIVEKADITVNSDDDNRRLSQASALHPNQDWTPAEEKALLRRIDLHIFPMLCAVFALSLLDRSNISAAYISGMKTDLHFNIGARYSIALLVFFPAFALCQIPSNLIIRRLGARTWLSFLITAFGVVVLGMGFVKSWIPMLVLRALLGAFEAGLLPGSIYMIASWYKTFETASRIAFFYTSALVASGFGGILAYGLTSIHVGNGMYKQSWRWIYIIEGLMTIAVGIASFFTIGEFPEKARWLKPREAHIARMRILNDRGEAEYKKVPLTQTLRLIRDPKLLLFCLQYFITSTSGYAIGYFFPIILNEGIGFSYTTSLILTSPPYIFTIIASLGLAWLSDKIRMRWPIIVFQGSVAIAGYLLILLPKIPGVRLFGVFLAVFGCQSNAAAVVAYAQNQTVGTEKRSMLSALMVTAGAAGGVTGSTIFRSQDAPLYLPGICVTLVTQLLLIVATFSMSMYLRRQNRLADEGKIGPLEGVEGFRYSP
ncbi:Uncharacterized protein BP5553_10672 [Venustampulla echinocandica]|uniref:Major facilitator superfamily (MFS) profile domain-containing protein n=1 Tax=Venustampulla echinocandica TaxID=2656787 RepID=A0A370T8Q6_9HELO|nr:Uncharacterized protein BP5553_10672 [Venustampulla echinocandica]RDL29807.1 Uncharacterized protein BP5553_10672 [Venustampulla echinocandica]